MVSWGPQTKASRSSYGSFSSKAGLQPLSMVVYDLDWRVEVHLRMIEFTVVLIARPIAVGLCWEDSINAFLIA